MKQTVTMPVMPRPKREGLYSDGTYTWEWDGSEWSVYSPAPYGMPPWPRREDLKSRVITTREALTDDDFEPGPVTQATVVDLPAPRCRGNNESRRRCGNTTEHPSGFCPHHRPVA